MEPRLYSALYIPDRGHFVWVDCDPQLGREQAGRRPALVLSPEAYNRPSGLFVVCPVTNQRKGYPFEAVIPSGLEVSGVVLCDQVKSLDYRQRKSVFAGKCPVELVEEVLAKLKPLLFERVR